MGGRGRLNEKQITMKNIKLTAFVLCICIVKLSSQNISESLLNYEDSYYTLFGKESGTISIDLIKGYSIGEVDTSYNVIISVANKEIVQEGFSLGTTILNSNNTFFSATNYAISKDIDQLILNYEEFIQFYECISSVFTYVGTKDVTGKYSTNIIASCGVNNLVVGGELLPKNSFDKPLLFYFKIGKRATYEMNKTQFISIIKALKDIKAILEENR